MSVSPFAKAGKSAAIAVLSVLAASAALVWFLVYTATPQGVLTVAALDVGQGDALYIEGPTGIRVLLDAGPGNGSVERALPRVMPQFARSFDAVVATHPDADHVGGFIDVLARYQVGAFVEPGIPDDTQTFTTIAQEVKVAHIPRYIARRGMVLDLGGGAELTVLYPDVDVSQYQKKTNEGCIVARVVYGATSALLTCDAPVSVEEHLLALDASGLRSTLLKVAHHGSKYSTSAVFVADVAPKEAVISVGANNRYGHPSPEVLAVLAAAHVPTLRTDQVGTVIFRSDGSTFVRAQ